MSRFSCFSKHINGIVQRSLVGDACELMCEMSKENFCKLNACNRHEGSLKHILYLLKVSVHIVHILKIKILFSYIL